MRIKPILPIGIDGSSGSVLIMVMIFCMVLFALGTSILGITISDYRLGQAFENSVKAYYLAEAGLEKVLYALSRMGSVNPEALLTTGWDMDGDDREVLNTGENSRFSVKVKEVSLVDTIYTDEQQLEVFAYIYTITLEAEGTVGTMRERAETVLEVQDFTEDGWNNEVTVVSWRKIP
jgi:hypothetical protein